mmetsp:Transcript_6139/g.11206  ORF Transcript_6139/g.11206 Transcript_6139/m.11206 type:complete len:227 (+) Transcript_6139:502-1182(+)
MQAALFRLGYDSFVQTHDFLVERVSHLVVAGILQLVEVHVQQQFDVRCLRRERPAVLLLTVRDRRVPYHVGDVRPSRLHRGLEGLPPRCAIGLDSIGVHPTQHVLRLVHVAAEGARPEEEVVTRHVGSGAGVPHLLEEEEDAEDHVVVVRVVDETAHELGVEEDGLGGVLGSGGVYRDEVVAGRVVVEFINQIDVKAVLSYDAPILLLGQGQRNPHQARVHDLSGN